jgi:RNA polymerase sigma-70 factor (ECF subfamily)
MMTSDDDVLRRAVAGDRQALVELLEAHGPKVRHALSASFPRKWQSLLSVDDVLQQAYTDAFRAITSLEPRGEGAFAGWLTTLAKRNLVDAIRGLEADKRGGNRQRVVQPNSDESFVALYEFVAASMTSPSGQAARSEARVHLEKAIEALPEDYKQIVKLYDLQGRPMEEVAKALDRSPGAAYMLRARAHRKLAELLGGASDFLSGG